MNSTYIGKLSLALLASVSAAFTASPAYGQTSGVSLDEIVVTAQKREESLQEITLAVSAISADKIESLNIEGAQDISGLAPNVTIVGGTTSLGASVISIRGIPSPATETFGLDTANGFYIDGVYIARSAATGLDVLDVERVEILRGPKARSLVEIRQVAQLTSSQSDPPINLVSKAKLARGISMPLMAEY